MKQNSTLEMTSQNDSAADRVKLATQIMIGLLASGHYTVPDTAPGAENIPAEPGVLRFDIGKDWKEDGCRQRFICHAVEDAVSLLKDLEQEVSEKFPAPAIPVVPPGYQLLPGGQWLKRHEITGKWIPAEPPHGEPVEDLVRRIAFPHLRDGGQWMQKGTAPATEPASSFTRACHYARQLRTLGMADADIQALLSDLYWDAATELELNCRAKVAP